LSEIVHHNRLAERSGIGLERLSKLEADMSLRPIPKSIGLPLPCGCHSSSLPSLI